MSFALSRWNPHRRTCGQLLLDYLRAQRQGPPSDGHVCRTIQITMPEVHTMPDDLEDTMQ